MKTKFIPLLVLSVIILFATSSCLINWNCVEGEGEVVSKKIELAAFSQIELSSPATVYLEQGSEQKVMIKAQQNLIDMLNTQVKSDEWDIKFEKCIKNAKDIEVYVTMVDVKSVEIAGSGEIIGKSPIIADMLELEIAGSGAINLNVKVEELDTEIAGSGDVKLEGKASSHEIEINGSGDINAYNMKCESVEVEINGSGDVKVEASSSIDVEVNGSGDVYYKGNPETVRTDINGSGGVNKGN